VVTRSDVLRAAARIGERVRHTPVLDVDGSVCLKLEYLQHSGSFKARGAFNRILAAAQAGELTAAGVVAASGGNAGLAFAYAAGCVAVPAEVYVPETAPAVKVAKLRALGATVVQHGQEYVAAYEAARKRQAETGAVFCHAYDQPEVVAGQGTVALELPAVDTVLVAVGGGGLVSGIAAALRGRSRVVGVEPESCPTLHAALAAGAPVDVPVGGVAADSLGARRLGDIAFDVVTGCQVGSVLVSDGAIVAARRDLWQRHRIVVEHGAATGWAALLSSAYRPEPGERVAVVLCGANTDPTDLG
jgi:threonine dehydratase